VNKLIQQAKMKAPQETDRPAGRRERRRAETRERIVRHALRLFSERGVSATTIEDITDAADIGKGTFFNYFPSKEHILGHICHLQMGKIREFVAQAIQSTEPMDGVMRRLALIITEEFARSPALVQSVLVPTFSSESMRQKMADDFREDRLILAELTAARQKRGEIRDDFTPVELARHFQQALFGTTVVWSLDASRPLSDCLREMAAILWAGMRSEHPPILERNQSEAEN
jgi:AcrR family transcriptional regulator